MPAPFATDTFRFSHLVKHEYEPQFAYCREVVTANEATAKTYAVGTVLGKVTAGGKYKIAVQTAVDGSQTAAALCLEDKAVAATTDTKVLCLVRGPSIVSKAALILDATYDLQAEKDAVYAALEAAGIRVNDAI
jgi:Bacteriophage lambda head decoration protein D